MKRRDFLIGSAIVAGSAVRFWGQDSDKAKLARIAIMTACFSSVVKNPAHPNDPKRTFELLDLPLVFAEHYGVHNLEPTCSHFTSTEKDYLDEFQARLKKADSQLNQISLGALSEEPGQTYGILNISSDNPVFRLEAIDLTKRWIDHAAYLRCPRVMVNQGLLLPAVRKETIETLKIMTDYGKSKNVKVTMETRGGAGERAGRAGEISYAGDWRVLTDVLKGAGAWANVDMGNYPNEEERHASMRVMMLISSGSTHAHYAPDRWSLHDAIQITKDVGYKGIFSIESGANNGPDCYAQVQTVRDALLKEL